MTPHVLAAAAALAFLASPALANCQDELSKLNDAITTAETGAATEPSGMPETKHQEEVLSGDKTGSTDPNGSSGGAVEALSPHQKEVTGAQQGATETPHPSELMKEADDLAKAGDEAGCMEKLTQLQQLIGEHD